MTGLSWQQVVFPFGSGINTFTHPTQLPIGEFVTLENTIWNQQGALSKRNGFTNLSNNILGETNNINSAIASAIYDDRDLLLFDVNNVYSYLAAQDKWLNRGTCTSLNIDQNSILNTSLQISNVNIATNNSNNVISYDRSDNTVGYSIIDSATNTINLNNKTILDANANGNTLPLVFGNLFLILTSSDDGRVLATILNFTNPNNDLTQTLIATLSTTNPRYDSTVYDGYLYIAYNYNTDDTVYLNKYDTNLALLSSSNLSTTNAAKGLRLFSDPNNNLSIAIISSTSEFTLKTLLPTPTYTSDPITLTTNVSHLNLINVDNTTVFYFDDNDTNLNTKEIYTLTVDYATTALSYTSFIKSAAISSDPFTFSDRQYFAIDYFSTQQPVTLIINNLAEIVGKLNYTSAEGTRSDYALPSNVILLNDNYILGSAKFNQIISENNKIFANPGAITITLSFTSNYQNVMMNKSLYITGGIVQQYDGINIVEQGFNLFPETISYSVLTDGDIPNGTYRYQFTYEWIDNNGQIVRSAPSSGTTIVINNGSGFGNVLFTLPCISFTKKDNVRIVAYRTQELISNQPQLYRITSETNPVLNVPTAFTTTFTDSNTDDDIITNNILYCTTTTDDTLVELENFPTPNSTIITAFGNRLFTGGSENKNQLFYSKTLVPTENPAFNPNFYLDLVAQGGPITALSVLDDALIIFKENSIYYLSGAGPTNNGQQNDFNAPTNITLDVGCVNANSVVLVSSLGIFFQSNKGIYLLDRSRTVSYIGYQVRQYNNVDIVSADQVVGTTQVRFTTSDSNLIYYDYFQKQWATFTNHRAVDAGIYLNKYYHITDNGIVHLENDSFIDNNTDISMRVKTGWLSFNQLQGAQRINYFFLLGDFLGHHSLTFNMYFDGSVVPNDTVTVNTIDIIDQSIYGENDIYGENGIYGGTYEGGEQWKIFPAIQRMQRMQLEIISNDLTPNAALNFVALLFKVGAKNSAQVTDNRQQ